MGGRRGEKLLGGVLSENNLVIVKREASPSCKPWQIKSMQSPVAAPLSLQSRRPPARLPAHLAAALPSPVQTRLQTLGIDQLEGKKGQLERYS